MPRNKLDADKYRREYFRKTIEKKMIDLNIENQEGLGKLMGFNQATVSGRLNFKRQWKYEELCKLFEVLHFKPDEILKVMTGVINK